MRSGVFKRVQFGSDIFSFITFAIQCGFSIAMIIASSQDSSSEGEQHSIPTGTLAALITVSIAMVLNQILFRNYPSIRQASRHPELAPLTGEVVSRALQPSGPRREAVRFVMQTGASAMLCIQTAYHGQSTFTLLTPEGGLSLALLFLSQPLVTSNIDYIFCESKRSLMIRNMLIGQFRSDRTLANRQSEISHLTDTHRHELSVIIFTTTIQHFSCLRQQITENLFTDEVIRMDGVTYNIGDQNRVGELLETYEILYNGGEPLTSYTPDQVTAIPHLERLNNILRPRERALRDYTNCIYRLCRLLTDSKVRYCMSNQKPDVEPDNDAHIRRLLLKTAINPGQSGCINDITLPLHLPTTRYLHLVVLITEKFAVIFKNSVEDHNLVSADILIPQEDEPHAVIQLRLFIQTHTTGDPSIIDVNQLTFPERLNEEDFISFTRTLANYSEAQPDLCNFKSATKTV